MFLTAAVFFLILTPQSPAQEANTELLREILCELKELRAAVRQGQVFAPLVDANIREREQARKQVTELERRVRDTERAVQDALALQTQLRDRIRRLPSSDTRALDPEVAAQVKNQLEIELKELERRIQTHQHQYNGAVADAANARSALNLLRQDFDDMQRQMRGVAAAGDQVCAQSAL